MASESSPKKPTHALKIIGNSFGNGEPIFVFAYQCNGVFFFHETGEIVVRHDGDAILQIWQLTE